MCWRLRDWSVSGSASVTLWCRRKTKSEWHAAKDTLFGHKQAALALCCSPIWILTIGSCLVYTKLPTLQARSMFPAAPCSLCVTNWIYAQSGACVWLCWLLPQLVRKCETQTEKLNKTVGELVCVKNYCFQRKWITRVWIAPFLLLQGVRKAISRSRPPARQCE